MTIVKIQAQLIKIIGAIIWRLPAINHDLRDLIVTQSAVTMVPIQAKYQSQHIKITILIFYYL